MYEGVRLCVLSLLSAVVSYSIFVTTVELTQISPDATADDTD